MKKILVSMAIVGFMLTACTSQGHVSSVTKPSSKPTTTNAATLVYRETGVGSKVLSVKFPSKPSTVTIRFTCVGNTTTQPTSLYSVGGGMLMRTSGCLKGEVFSAEFTQSKRHNPNQARLTVAPGTHWAIEFWSGKYTQETHTLGA